MTLVFLDPHDRFFEQENNLEFFTNNIDQQATAGSIRRRVSSMFGDAKSEGRYYEPQKISDDALLDVCKSLLLLRFSTHINSFV